MVETPIAIQEHQQAHTKEAFIDTIAQMVTSGVDMAVAAGICHSRIFTIQSGNSGEIVGEGDGYCRRQNGNLQWLFVEEKIMGGNLVACYEDRRKNSDSVSRKQCERSQSD